jgi:hypothetical protein
VQGDDITKIKSESAQAQQAKVKFKSRFFSLQYILIIFSEKQNQVEPGGTYLNPSTEEVGREERRF